MGARANASGEGHGRASCMPTCVVLKLPDSSEEGVDGVGVGGVGRERVADLVAEGGAVFLERGRVESSRGGIEEASLRRSRKRRCNCKCAHEEDDDAIHAPCSLACSLAVAKKSCVARHAMNADVTRIIRKCRSRSYLRLRRQAADERPTMSSQVKRIWAVLIARF